MCKEIIEAFKKMGKFLNKDNGIITAAVVVAIAPLLLSYLGIIHLSSAEMAASIGVIAFVIPIILGFSERFNLASRFGNGEVRKAIVISLTIIYIILLSTYFFNVTLPLSEKALNGSNQMANISTAQKLIGMGAKGLNETLVGGNWTLTQINQIPSEALRDITTNFMWAYAIIIIFYFGSRAWESVAETNMVKELKDISPLDLAKRRYILGSISPENYIDIQKNIKENEVILVDATPNGTDQYSLIIRNMDSKERNVETWSVNEISQTVNIKIPSRGYRVIAADIPSTLKTTPPKDYIFEIKSDGAPSSISIKRI